MKFVPVAVKGVEISKEHAKIIAEDFRKALPLIEYDIDEFICHAVERTSGRTVTLNFIQRLISPCGYSQMTSWVGWMFHKTYPEFEESFWENQDYAKMKNLRVAFLKYHIQKFEKYAKE